MGETGLEKRADDSKNVGRFRPLFRPCRRHGGREMRCKLLGDKVAATLVRVFRGDAPWNDTSITVLRQGIF